MSEKLYKLKEKEATILQEYTKIREVEENEVKDFVSKYIGKYYSRHEKNKHYYYKIESFSISSSNLFLTGKIICVMVYKDSSINIDMHYLNMYSRTLFDDISDKLLCEIPEQDFQKLEELIVSMVKFSNGEL